MAMYRGRAEVRQIRERRWKLRDDLGKALFPVAHASLHRIADLIRLHPHCDVRTDWQWMHGGRELSGQMVIRWDREINGQSYGCHQVLTVWALEAAYESDYYEMRVAERFLACIREVLPEEPERCWCGNPAKYPRTATILAHCCIDHQVPALIPASIADLATPFRVLPAEYQPPGLAADMTIDGVRLVPGQAFGRSLDPSSEDGIYRISAGKWNDID